MRRSVMIKQPKRRPPRRDVGPAEVVETVRTEPATPKPPEEALPDEIRKMLEAAYT